MKDSTPFGRARALEMDEEDELRHFRDRFHIPSGGDGTGCIYLLGNSLGLQPRQTPDRIGEVLSDWQNMGVEAYFRADSPWIQYSDLLKETLGKIVGAKPLEIAVMNSLTVNLHLLMVSFYRPVRERHKILVEKSAFPSDRYAVASQIRNRGFDPEESVLLLTPRSGEDTIRTEDAVAFIAKHGSEIALILLGGVNYYSGDFLDIAAITDAGHRAGCVVGFDLAHAAGNVPLKLHDWDVDFAAWCGYKYLNSGPGGPGGAFVHERHSRNTELMRLSGWWGHERESRFQMPDDFSATPGADGWQISTPSILALSGLKSSLELFEEAGFERLVSKSRRLTSYLERLIDLRIGDRVEIITPSDPDRRGAQLSLRVGGGQSVVEYLASRQVTCDWREPDVIRLAPVPLYNSFTDVFDFVETLDAAIPSQS